MEVGSKIGDWETQKLLGSGAFGSVYLIKSTKSDTALAVKVCHWKLEEIQAKFVTRWNKEVETMNSVDNENIVMTKKADDLTSLLLNANIAKLPVLCMEYCEGGNLRQLLSRPENANGLPEQEVRCLLKDLTSAVSYLHKLNITHRTLKPESIVLKNIQVPLFKRTFIYKLTNLGCLKEVDSDTVCSNFTGSLQYLAPELFYTKTYNNTVDYWSFGLIAFEAICGIRPFLPNMAPVQWMTFVKNKSSEHICAYEKLNEEITFSNEIYNENNISNCLKSMLEVWFVKMLEWDPQKRGQKPASDNIFTDLVDILDKKVIVIFSVSTYEILSYEIDENTLFATLQGWILRDTQININDQIFINNTDKCDVELESFAIKYWSDKVKVMLYLYRKDKLIEYTKPKISPKIKLNIENPKMNLNYFQCLGVISYIHYFISNQQVLYETFKEAIVLRFECVKDVINKLKSFRRESEKQLNNLESKSSLLKEMVASEMSCIDKYNNQNKMNFVDEMKLWIPKANALNDDIAKLKEAWNQLGARLESIIRRSNEICLKQNNTELLELLKSVRCHILTVSMIPINDRKHQKSCYNVIKLFYKSMSARERIVYDPENQKVAQIIADVHLESQKIGNLFTIVDKNVDSLSRSVNKLIIDKQEIPWKTVVPMEKRDESLGVRSLTNFKIGEPVRSPVPLLPDHSSLELQSLIDDSVRLRKNTQDFIKMSHKMQSIINEELYDYIDDGPA